MRKGKLARSVLALGMSLSLMAAPAGAAAETAGETELDAVLAEVVDEKAQALASGATEGHFEMTFGDALYDLAAQDGTDLSWLETVSFNLKMVPAQDALAGEAVIGINDSDVYHFLGCVDMADGTVYFSAPEFSDQAIAVNLKEFSGNVLSGSEGDGSESDGLYGQIVRMLADAGMQAAFSLADYFRSVSPDVWQQEMMDYLMPVMTAVQQETGEDEIVVGDRTAQVQAQIFDIPSENMGTMLSNLLTTLSNDPVIEGLFQSEAVEHISSLVSMMSGGSVSISGTEILEQLRAGLQGAANSDFSSIPGLRFVIHNSEDGNANGIYLGAWYNGQLLDILSFSSIREGTEHCFEIVPGDVLLSMMGMASAGPVDVSGQGSTADSMMNESVEVTVGGQTAGSLTIKDLDLASLQQGDLIGTIRFQIQDLSGEIVYGVEEDGVRTITYSINDEIFYDAFMYFGVPENDRIDMIDPESALRIASVDDAVKWISSFDMEGALGLLKQASGIGGGETEPETEPEL